MVIWVTHHFGTAYVRNGAPVIRHSGLIYIEKRAMRFFFHFLLGEYLQDFVSFLAFNCVFECVFACVIS